MGKVIGAQASYVSRPPKMASGSAIVATSKWMRGAFAIATELHLGNLSLSGSRVTCFSTKPVLPVLTLYTKVFGSKVIRSFYRVDLYQFVKLLDKHVTEAACMGVSLL